MRSFCKLLNVLSWRISVTSACSLSAGRQTCTGSSRPAFWRKCTRSTLCTTCSRPLSNFTQGSYYTETSRYYNSCDSLQCLTEEEFSWSCEYGQVRSAFWLFLLLCFSIHWCLECLCFCTRSIDGVESLTRFLPAVQNLSTLTLFPAQDRCLLVAQSWARGKATNWNASQVSGIGYYKKNDSLQVYIHVAL